MMLRLPVSSKVLHLRSWTRSKSSSCFIRSTFVDYFVGKHGHKYVKSSSVVPLYDASVPFVNAGMNQVMTLFLHLATFVIDLRILFITFKKLLSLHYKIYIVLYVYSYDNWLMYIGFVDLYVYKTNTSKNII